MKRSPPPKRRKPLRAKKGLAPGGPLRPKKRDPVRDRRDDEYRFAVLSRAHSRCEAKTPVCTGRADDVHHRRGRVGADRWDVDLGLAVCRACHDYIETHRAEGYEKGWLVRRLGTDTL